MPIEEILPICHREQQPSPRKWLRLAGRSRPVTYAAKRDARRLARRGYAKHVANRREKEWLRSISRDLASADPAQRKAYVERRFRELATKWESETAHLSSLTDVASHPSYASIIKLGWEVVPLLLDDLRQNHRFWFPALQAITTIRPFDLRDTGNGKRMTDAWIQWGIKKGII